MELRYYPLNEEVFLLEIEPLIKSHYKRCGRPASISRYQFFCAVL